MLQNNKPSVTAKSCKNHTVIWPHSPCWSIVQKRKNWNPRNKEFPQPSLRQAALLNIAYCWVLILVLSFSRKNSNFLTFQTNARDTHISRTWLDRQVIIYWNIFTKIKVMNKGERWTWWARRIQLQASTPQVTVARNPAPWSLLRLLPHARVLSS